MPQPRFLKGSGMHSTQTEQTCRHQGGPQFLKGGKDLRRSQPAPALQEAEVAEEDDACEEELRAEVAREYRQARSRKRMRRHERGYNEAAQVKALECTILSAGMPLPLPATCMFCTNAGDASSRAKLWLQPVLSGDLTAQPELLV